MAPLLDLDASLSAWVVSTLRHPLLDPLMLGLSAAGYYGAVWVVMHLALTWRSRPLGPKLMALWRLVLTLGLTVLLVDYVLKPFVARPRPFTVDPALPLLYTGPVSLSFPSGHAALAFAGAYATALAWPRYRVWWWVLALAIACSRVYLGVHYPLDVIGGAVVGLAVAAFATAGTPARDPR